MRLVHSNFQDSRWFGSLAPVCALSVIFWSVPVGAAEQPIPWECTGFAGDAQARCTATFAELQQEKITKLERELEAQKQQNQQFQQQIAQQASATAKLERKLTRKRSRWYNYPSLQIYPPIGLNFHYGRHRFFGGSLFSGNSRHYGPRFFGYGHRRWHRH